MPLVASSPSRKVRIVAIVGRRPIFEATVLALVGAKVENPEAVERYDLGAGATRERKKSVCK